MIRTACSLLFVTVLLATTPILAGEISLPNDFSWCQDRASVEVDLIVPKEISDGVLEAQAQEFGLSGFINTVFEGDALYEVRFRAFETEAAHKFVVSSLQKRYGDGVAKGKGFRWELDEDQVITLKFVSEQIYVGWSVPSERCGVAPKTEIGETEQERKDRDAMKKRKVVEFDPYADDVDDESDFSARGSLSDEDARAAEKARQKKKEAERKQEKKDTKDADIDW